jgi:NADPH:quinone reductase-like Zn-dependent oxidoreductase
VIPRPASGASGDVTDFMLTIAFVKQATFSSFGLDHLRVEPAPSAGPLGAYGVLVRVRAVALNYRDLLMLEGLYNPKQPLPLTPCSDAAGEVVAVGPSVSRFAVGDRVVSCFAPAWIDGPPDAATLRSTLGGPLPGVLAEEVVLTEAGLVHAPDYLSFEEACTLPCAGLTAWSALSLCLGSRFTRTGSQVPASVLILGTGGVSLFALQLAKLRGLRSIVTSKSDDKLALARKMGADHTINYVQVPEWGKAARALSQDGNGVDVVIEVGGAGTLLQSARATRAGGAIAVIGVLSGSSDLPASVVTSLLMNQIRMQGVYVGHRMGLSELCEALTAASVKPVVDKVFALEDAQDAFRYLKSGAHFGKVVIRV